MHDPEKKDDAAEHPLLIELSFLDDGPDAGTASGDAALLGAYRRGELGGDESEALERRLAGSARLRQELARSAGRELPSPSPFLKARVLRAYRGGRQRRRRIAPPVWLAAVLALGVGFFLLRSVWISPDLPQGLTYTVSGKGLAEVRSGEVEAGGAIKAYAETPVELTVAPDAVADAEVEFAVYRWTETLWRRVASTDDAKVERGIAIFTLPASQLVGLQPGEYELLVAVARPGGLPATLTAEAVKETDPSRRFYRRKLILEP